MADVWGATRKQAGNVIRRGPMLLRSTALLNGTNDEARITAGSGRRRFVADSGPRPAVHGVKWPGRR